MNIHGLGLVLESMLSNLDFVVVVDLKPEVSRIGRLVYKPLEFQVVNFEYDLDHHLVKLIISKFIPLAPLGKVVTNSEINGESIFLGMNFCTLSNSLVQIDVIDKGQDHVEDVSVHSSLSSLIQVEE
ncbi:hypothetical protein NI392_09645 [Vibrio alginolyticus]|uniref:hypothetical protein n=2 Tax=Vibrio TaxID=662 RepID=UPI0028F450B1|nr:hypothetical protein [Vibrio alginolyticus]WMN48414.1 hypothetical protein NI392_09645 [Vibrio alginolyticus]